jgi:dihydrodipicolinate synthase/N-acetylneuraminate lyase
MATLTLEEWQTFARVVAETSREAAPDMPVFIGATTLGSRETVDRIRFLRDLGMHGAFLGRPFWSQLGPETLVRYYEDIADAFPDMSFVLYDNPEAFKGPIPPPAYARLAKHPGIIGVKYSLITPKFRSDVVAVGKDLRILPIEADWLVARTLYPDLMPGCWSSSACCGPEPAVALRDAFEEDDFETAQWLTGRIEWTYDVFLARANFPEFSRYNIPLEKVRFDEAGFVKAGPTRAPYHVVPDEYMEGARENGRRWRQVAGEIVERSAAVAQ